MPDAGRTLKRQCAAVSHACEMKASGFLRNCGGTSQYTGHLCSRVRYMKYMSIMTRVGVSQQYSSCICVGRAEGTMGHNVTMVHGPVCMLRDSGAWPCVHAT